MVTIRLVSCSPVLASLAAVLAACGGLAGYFQDPPTVDWVTSFDKVAGQWEGKARQVLPDRRDDGRIVLTIQDNGAYQFTGDKSSDVSWGAGKLVISNGRLLALAKDRSALLTLHEQGKEQSLGVDVTLKTGERYYVEMQKAGTDGKAPPS